MPYLWMDEYFLGKPGTSSDYQPDWQATRYFLADKMYAMSCKDMIDMAHRLVFGKLSKKARENLPVRNPAGEILLEDDEEKI